MEDVTVEIDLGKVNDLGNYLRFSLKLRNNGSGYLQVYAGESDCRRAGTLLHLGSVNFEILKTIVGKADQAIENLKQTGQMKELEYY